jgi:hypothetical protein
MVGLKYAFGFAGPNPARVGAHGSRGQPARGLASLSPYIFHFILLPFFLLLFLLLDFLLDFFFVGLDFFMVYTSNGLSSYTSFCGYHR